MKPSAHPHPAGIPAGMRDTNHHAGSGGYALLTTGYQLASRWDEIRHRSPETTTAP